MALRKLFTPLAPFELGYASGKQEFFFLIEEASEGHSDLTQAAQSQTLRDVGLGGQPSPGFLRQGRGGAGPV